jgi:hypothetical protein
VAHFNILILSFNKFILGYGIFILIYNVVSVHGYAFLWDILWTNVGCHIFGWTMGNSSYLRLCVEVLER